jgi:hypothetical protein
MGRFFAGSGIMSARIASKTTLNWLSYLRSSAASLRARSACAPRIWRNRTKARIIPMLTMTARLLRGTLESMATPCSVKA